MRKSINLSMNEMPYLPPENVVIAARKGLLNLNRYAEQKDLEHLKSLLAQYSGVPEEHIVLSPGSDLLLREIVHSFSGGRKVVMISPSFLPTIQAAKQFTTKHVSIRLGSPNFDLNPELLLEELEIPSLVIIDNPNNPTGKILLEKQTVGNILSKKNTLLVIDEAYFEFSGVTFADMISDYPNLAITRTMDKAFSLAGARVGYLLAGKYFLKALSSFSSLLPQASLQAAAEALISPAYMRKNVRLILDEKKRIEKEIKNSGSTVYPGSTNFLLVKTEIPDISMRLKDISLLVSDVSSQLAPGFIRVSMGTREENDTFIDGYKKILKEIEK